MDEYIITKKNALTSIADAIRKVKNTTDLMSLEQMPDMLSNVSSVDEILEMFGANRYKIVNESIIVGGGCRLGFMGKNNLGFSELNQVKLVIAFDSSNVNPIIQENEVGAISFLFSCKVDEDKWLNFFVADGAFYGKYEDAPALDAVYVSTNYRVDLDCYIGSNVGYYPNPMKVLIFYEEE